MENIKKHIVGTWRLVHSISIDSNGHTEYPYGQDAIGYIYYGDAGIMAVQISRKARKDEEDLSALKHGYLAYFGRYEIDTAEQVVRHFVEGELFPGGHSEVLLRRYRFDGDLMSLKPVDGTNREILWQRVRDENVVQPRTRSAFAIFGFDGTNGAAKREVHRPAHLKNLAMLNAQKRLIFAGALADGTGSLIIIGADSLGEAETVAKEDPYTVNGIFSRIEVRPFKSVFPE